MTDIASILQRPYTRSVKRDETGAYVATIREFMGCIADGDTVAQAMERLESAAESWLAAAIAMGQDIPEPMPEFEASGKFALRLPRSMHQQAIERATLEGTSVNQFFVTAIAYRLGADEATGRTRRSEAAAARHASQPKPLHFRTMTLEPTAYGTTTARVALAHQFHLMEPFVPPSSPVSGEMSTVDQLVAARKRERRTKERNG